MSTTSHLHVRARSTPALAVLGAVLAPVLFAEPAVAQDADHGEDHAHEPASHDEAGGSGHHAGLHFTHPLVAESVSPDTKLRLDYGYQDVGAENASELELEGEYAFHRSISVEAGVHFDASGGEIGETHVLAKFANYAFEEQGLSLGYGMAFGLPTGAGHGHGHGGDAEEEEHAGEEHEEEHAAAEAGDDVYEFAPFLNAGLSAGPWELVAWTRYAIPTNQAERAALGPELRFDVSALLHATDRIEPVLEMNGTVGLGGPQAERETLTLSPGLRVRPIADHPLVVGSSVSLPLTDERAFDARVLVSAFWHF